MSCALSIIFSLFSIFYYLHYFVCHKNVTVVQLYREVPEFIKSSLRNNPILHAYDIRAYNKEHKHLVIQVEVFILEIRQYGVAQSTQPSYREGARTCIHIQAASQEACVLHNAADTQTIISTHTMYRIDKIKLNFRRSKKTPGCC